MPISDDVRERLDRMMNDRRLELGLTWREVAERAGLSYEALRGIRTSGSGMRELTAVKIARALEWDPQAVLRILVGGEPQLAARDQGIPADAPVCTFETDVLSASVSEVAKGELIRAHRLNGHRGCTPLAEPKPGIATVGTLRVSSG
jgi:hypothetical protein